MNTEKINQFVEETLRELSKKYPNRKDLSDLSFEDRNLAMFCLDIREAYGEMINWKIFHEAEKERQEQIEKAVV